MSDIAQQTVPGAEAAPYRWRWAAFAVVLAGSVMDLLDSLATNVAGPSIRADIGGGPTLLQWLLASYTLVMAIGLITGGRLGDLYGRRPVLLRRARPQWSGVPGPGASQATTPAAEPA